ncbi:MAG TPA: thioredoxin family protein [Verrucomicrobiae bacterium]|nr:thioredoxin family protein [Verrucomicrobiae bacterium]
MRIGRSVVMTMAAMALVASASAEALKLGEKAPDASVKMKSVDGKEVSIADVAGPKGTLVFFTCNHCPFVKAWETRIAEIGNMYSKKGVGVIAINSNDPADFAEDSYAEMQARAKQRGFEFPYVVDATSDVGRAFGATRTPEFFLFDASGKLVYHGALDDNKDAKSVEKHYLQEALNALLDGKPIPVAETKAVGCSIKFRAKA